MITAVGIDGSTIVYRNILDFSIMKKAKIETSDTRMDTFLRESGYRHKSYPIVSIQESTGQISSKKIKFYTSSRDLLPLLISVQKTNISMGGVISNIERDATKKFTIICAATIE